METADLVDDVRVRAATVDAPALAADPAAVAADADEVDDAVCAGGGEKTHFHSSHDTTVKPTRLQ